MIQQAGVEKKIDIYDDYIPDKEVEKFFAACDLVVLPYVSATQSGIVQIAYGFNKPVVATNICGLPEVILDGQTGYIVQPKTPGAIANAVIAFFTDNKSLEFEDNIEKEAYKFSWDRMTETVEELWIK